VFYLLPSVKTRTLGNDLICRVLEWKHTAKTSHTANVPLCRVSTLGKQKHTANTSLCRLGVSRRQRFAECGPLALDKMASLPSVNQKHSAKCTVCRVFLWDTRQNKFFCFCLPIFSVGFLRYLDQHARI
jgi:hypothetical protein